MDATMLLFQGAWWPKSCFPPRVGWCILSTLFLTELVSKLEFAIRDLRPRHISTKHFGAILGSLVSGVATCFLSGATRLQALGGLFADSFIARPLSRSKQDNRALFLHGAQFRTAIHGLPLRDTSTKPSFLNLLQYSEVSTLRS